jgi:hypothetical protein
MPLRIRRGTDAERLLITPLEGELIYTTDTKHVYVGDSETVGGLNISTLTGYFGGPLGQDLDLNGFNITGLGDINTIGNQDLSGNLAVGGNITAQGNITANGNIVLGNSNGDTVSIGGIVSSDIVPAFSNLQLGTTARPWGTLHVNGVQAGGLIEGNVVGNVYGQDSSIIIDAATNTISGNIVGSTFDGTFKGSFFGDDSTCMLDGINLIISNGSITINQDTIDHNDLYIGDYLNNSSVYIRSNSPNVLTTFVKSDFNYAAIRYSSSNGTVKNPTPLEPGDMILNQAWLGHDGTDYFYSGSIGFVVDNNETPSAGNVPGKLVIATGATGDKLITWDYQGRMGVNVQDAQATLDVGGTFKLAVLTAEPSPKYEGMIAVADNDTWDPCSLGGGLPYPVFYNGSVWLKMFS